MFGRSSRLARALKEDLERLEQQETRGQRATKNAARIHAAIISFHKKEAFAVGDAVMWKEDLANRNFPEVGQKVIVAEIYDTPLVDTTIGSGDADFGEPLDMRVAAFTNIDTMVSFAVDSRRFTKA